MERFAKMPEIEKAIGDTEYLYRNNSALSEGAKQGASSALATLRAEISDIGFMADRNWYTPCHRLFDEDVEKMDDNDAVWEVWRDGTIKLIPATDAKYMFRESNRFGYKITNYIYFGYNPTKDEIATALKEMGND